MTETGRSGIQVQAPEPTVFQCYSAFKGCTDLLGKKCSFRIEYLFFGPNYDVSLGSDKEQVLAEK